MPIDTNSYLVNLGKHDDQLNKGRMSQKDFDVSVKNLSKQPGSNSQNRDQHQFAQALVSLLTIANAVSMPAITSQRARQLAVQNRLVYADTLYQGSVAKQEFGGSASEESKSGASKTQGTPPKEPQESTQRLKPTNSHTLAPIQNDVKPNWIANVLNKVGQVLPDDPFKFPGAEALVRPTTTQTTTTNLPTTSTPPTTINYETQNNAVTKSLFHELIDIHALTMPDASDAEPIILLYPTPQVPAEMRQDESQELQNIAYQKYISNNCHIRTKTNNGTVIGNTLLVSAETMRNPIRAAAEKLQNKYLGGHPLPSWLVKFTEGANVAYDVVLGVGTAGKYPIFKYGSAKALAVSGHAANQDTTCLKREFSPEELAQLLFDTDPGITDRHAFHDYPVHPRAREFKNAGKFVPEGTFIHENSANQINTVKYVTINHQGTSYYIKEKNPGEFWTFHHAAVKPELVEKRVYFDAVNDQIHFDSEMPAGQGLDYDIVDGKKFVSIYGENHEITWNWDKKKPEVVLNKKNGETVSIPAYMDPLSKRWHLSIHNDRAVFSDTQQSIINEISIKKNSNHNYIPENNNNPQLYGTGKTYRATQKEDSSQYILGRYVEMGGELLPTKQRVTPEHGVHYEVYDPKNPNGKSWPIEWDGTRWLFESPTSVHISAGLEKQVTPEMLSSNSIDARDISAPDDMGLRYNKQGERFIKVKNKLVKIYQLQSHPDLINRFYIKNDKGRNFYIRFKEDGKFHAETYSERLAVIKKIGLGGGEHAEKRILFSDVSVYDAATGLTKPHQFTVTSEGDYNAELLLFPENGIPLSQLPLDATAYERAISSLSENQKTAIRTWTLVEHDHGRYSDGSRNLWAEGHEPINYEINMALRNKLPLSTNEKFVHDNLISALSGNNIPTQKGSYLRTAEYTASDTIPWKGEIKPGDVVTNSPTFMSVSSSDKYAKEALSWETSTGKDVEAIVVYKIDNATRAKPLLADAASTVRYEEEYLYLPDSYFKVKGISHAKEENGLLRIAVTLEEIEKPATVIAKNIFTGKEVK